MSVHLPADRDRDAWQLAVWNADDAVLGRAQKLQLMLMIEAGFNAFDPFRVVAGLLSHRDLWDAVVMERGFPAGPPAGVGSTWHLHADLIALRDLPGGHWNVDTVYLLHDRADTAALTKLAGGWKADEIGTVPDGAVGALLGSWGPNDPRAILRVWWD